MTRANWPPTAGLGEAIRKSGGVTDDGALCRVKRMRKAPEPIHYQIRRAILADPALSSTAKLVADALLLNFLNTKTGQCNPSLSAIAKAVGRCRRTVITAINELKSGNDQWLIVKSTGGGSTDNTNNYDFRLKGTGAVHSTSEAYYTGAENVGTGEADRTEGVKQTAHELSNELSRTIDADHVEAAGPDRSLRRSLTGALRDPGPKRERDEIVQDRIAKRLPDGWNSLGELPLAELERLTELERTGELTDAVLGLAIAAARICET
ncbi:helix-turn-helix domain-containing protein [Bradyrhizobium sp. RT11b]|uniref:helix-turn-helix domain-containing protein n=1 Tax=Bradyrhizobium sp. RT11b TaxID=3156332 RepID=UPI003395F56D